MENQPPTQPRCDAERPREGGYEGPIFPYQHSYIRFIHPNEPIPRESEEHKPLWNREVSQGLLQTSSLCEVLPGQLF